MVEFQQDPILWEYVDFNNKTRELVVFLIIFIGLYIISYGLIAVYRKKQSSWYSGTYEDVVVFRISLWICTFSLGVSIGAALLLPMSIISNEILLWYPNHYYVQWLNTSLIQGLWNLVFLFSNVALFILLPFAHLFIESAGFPGSKKGIRARICETLLVLTLLGLLLMGVTYIVSAMLDEGYFSITSFFNLSNYYLPFLYSCVSFLGVLMLLICTPLGFARLFSVMSKLIFKQMNPHIFRKSDYAVLWPPKDASYSAFPMNKPYSNQSRYTHSDEIPVGYQPMKPYRRRLHENIKVKNKFASKSNADDLSSYASGFTIDKDNGLKRKALLVGLYPLIMTFLVFLTVVSVLKVILNSLELCFGIKALPIYSQNLSLGIKSLSTLGVFGSAFEIFSILYLWCTSIVGLYSLPVFIYLKPQLNETSTTQIIGNCAILHVLSSALPVLARSLGITNFDLLGDFGRINWLGNFYIVLFHNIVFAVTAVICLGTKITAAVRNELYLRLCNIRRNPFLYVFLSVI